MFWIKKKPELTEAEKEAIREAKIKDQEKFVFTHQNFDLIDMFVIFNKTEWVLVKHEDAVSWISIQATVRIYNIVKEIFPDDALEILKFKNGVFSHL